MMYVDNLIIGAGITGLSAAYHFQEQDLRYLIVDKAQPAGLCNTVTVEGFFFDISGHVIHHQTTLYEDFVKKIMGANLLSSKRKAYFAFRQHLLPYPFQVYFYELSDREIVNECIQGLEHVIEGKVNRIPRNFEEWIIANFGEGISKNFMIPYNRKVWRFPLKKMSLEWVERYVPKPDAAQILRLARGIDLAKREYGYNPSFFYPKLGGIKAFVDAIKEKLGSQFVSSFIESPLQKVDINRKIAILRNGTKIRWNRLISTIPLPNLVSLLNDAPNVIKFYAKSLKFTSLVSINLGVRQEIDTDAHWIYFPESSIPFHRVVIQSNLSPYVSPDLTHSLIVEKSMRSGERFDRKKEINQTIAYMLKKRLIKSKSAILLAKANYIKYAYPIYDTDLYNKRSYLLTFLRNYNVYSIGRFGSWKYLSMEDCFMQGRDASMNVIEGQ